MKTKKLAENIKKVKILIELEFFEWMSNDVRNGESRIDIYRKNIQSPQ